MENQKMLGAMLFVLLVLPLAPSLEPYRFAIWKSLGLPVRRFVINMLKMICWRMKWGL